MEKNRGYPDQWEPADGKVYKSPILKCCDVREVERNYLGGIDLSLYFTSLRHDIESLSI